MDVAAILQALLGAGAPAAAPSVAGPLDATFAALFAAAAGTTPAAGATPGTKLARPDEHVDVPPAPTADAQVLSLAGAAIAAVSPPVVPSATPVAASPPAAAPATDATTVAASPTVERPCVSAAAPVAAEQVPVPAAPGDPSAPLARPQATPQSAAPAATPVSVEPDAPAADEAQASAEPAAPTRVAEHAPSAKPPTLPPAALPDAKPSEEAPAATAKPVPHAETATGTQHDDAVAESVEPAVDRVAPRRTVEPAAATPASAGHTAAAAVQAAGTRTEADVGRESGHPAARRASEGSEATVKGGDAAPGPTPLSPSTTTREHERVEIATPEAPAARAGAEHDVERLVRLDQLRPVRVRDGGEMRMEVAAEGLGRVEVRVEVRADAVHAALYAQQDHARDALVAHRPALEAALGRSHLKLETFSVGVGQHELGDSDRRTPQSEPAHDEPGPRRPSSPSVAAAAPATTLTPTASGGLSLRA